MLKALITLSALLLAGCSSSTPSRSTPSKPATPPITTSAAPMPASTPADVGSGVHVTPSGLKYEVLKRGTGTVHPTASDTVTVHYHGTLLNGTVFDSSVRRGEPATFPLNGVIAGWTEGLQLMRVGDKFKFVIPSNLAYGVSSPSPLIPPLSTLLFEVELLAINGSTL